RSSQGESRDALSSRLATRLSEVNAKASQQAALGQIGGVLFQRGEDRLVGFLVTILRINRIGRVYKARRSLHLEKPACFDVSARGSRWKITRPACRQQRADPDSSEVERQTGDAVARKGECVVRFEFRSPIDENIVGQWRLDVAACRDRN